MDRLVAQELQKEGKTTGAIPCPGCHAPVRLRRQLAQKAIAKCPSCRGILKVAFEDDDTAKVESFKALSLPIDLPIEVTDGHVEQRSYRGVPLRTGRRFRYAVRRHWWWGAALVPMALVWNVGMLGMIVQMVTSKFPPVALVALPHIFAGVLMLRESVGMLVNSIVLEIQGGVLTVRSTPLPIAGRTASIPMKEIESISVSAEWWRRRQPGLLVQLRSGKTKFLHVKDLAQESELTKLRMEVEKFLREEREGVL